MERLELSRREAQVPKTCVSTIPPHPLWCLLRDLNSRPTDYKSVALPTELNRLYLFTLQIGQKSLLSNSNLHSGHLFISILILYLGGQPGIRTLGPLLTFVRLVGGCFKPLSHASVFLIIVTYL